MHFITLLCKRCPLQGSSLIQSTFYEYLCKYLKINVLLIPKQHMWNCLLKNGKLILFVNVCLKGSNMNHECPLLKKEYGIYVESVLRLNSFFGRFITV